jgi:SAM-dependent methyltransferase
MTKLYHVRTDCRLCLSSRLERVVPLAGMPIATPNFRVAGVSKDDPAFREAVPLNLDLCKECGLLQVTVVGDAHTQFDNYVYTTSLSVGLTRHFKNYADEVTLAVKPEIGALVVELGSNDGTLLRFFQAKGFRVQGCDPAAAIAAQATAKGIPTLPEFFGTDAARQIRGEHGPATIVLANNVIANIDDLDDLVTGVRNLLADDGVFVFETQYGLDLVRHNLLDTVYHEHLSYFYVRPLTLYFSRLDMQVIDVLPVATKGGSIRVTVQKAGGTRNVAQAVGEFLALEQREGAYGDEIYVRLVKRIAAIRDGLHRAIDPVRASGRPVAGYGASVGTTTLLAQFDLGGRIDMLFDDDPKKQEFLHGPGYDLPIFGGKSVLEHNPAIIVMFAWRYVDPILSKHQVWLDRGGRVAMPLPDLHFMGKDVGE